MSNKVEAAFHGKKPREIHVWYPLFDKPVRIDMSEEQLALVISALRGERVEPVGWYEFIASELNGDTPRRVAKTVPGVS